jgi:hypothetical protein
MNLAQGIELERNLAVALQNKRIKAMAAQRSVRNP